AHGSGARSPEPPRATRLLDLGFLALLDALAPRALGVVGARLERPIPPTPFDHRLAADRARLVEDLRAFAHLAVLADVGAVLAFGVPRAGEERAVAAGALHQLPFPTLRAFLTGGLRLRLRRIALDVLAIRIARAPDELSVATRALLQGLATHGARLVEQLGFRHLAIRRH